MCIKCWFIKIEAQNFEKQKQKQNKTNYKNETSNEVHTMNKSNHKQWKDKFLDFFF